MLRSILALALALVSAPAAAEDDEIEPVAAQVLAGRAYFGSAVPSQIRFINVRERAVKLVWITFEGGEREYAVIQPGQEIIQPTFVAHRWLVKDQGDGTPLQAFISTRSAARDNGTAQIALIR